MSPAAETEGPIHSNRDVVQVVLSKVSTAQDTPGLINSTYFEEKAPE